jgi:hypothetical protein
LALDERGEDAERKEEASTTEIAKQVERWHRRSTGATDCVEHARQRYVVEVVTRGVRERSVLPPPRHSAIDEPRVSVQAGIRTDPKAFGDSWAEALDQRVGGLHEPEDGRETRCVF